MYIYICIIVGISLKFYDCITKFPHHSYLVWISKMRAAYIYLKICVPTCV